MIVALLIAAALVWFFALRDTTSQAPVPKVTDLLQQQAERKLKNRGFDVQTALAPNQRPPGTVLEQDPRAGTVVDEGSTVTLTVSSGPGVGTVPNVVGKTGRRRDEDLGEIPVQGQDRAPALGPVRRAGDRAGPGAGLAQPARHDP